MKTDCAKREKPLVLSLINNWNLCNYCSKAASLTLHRRSLTSCSVTFWSWSHVWHADRTSQLLNLQQPVSVQDHSGAGHKNIKSPFGFSRCITAAWSAPRGPCSELSQQTAGYWSHLSKPIEAITTWKGNKDNLNIFVYFCSFMSAGFNIQDAIKAALKPSGYRRLSWGERTEVIQHALDGDFTWGEICWGKHLKSFLSFCFWSIISAS